MRLAPYTAAPPWEHEQQSASNKKNSAKQDVLERLARSLNHCVAGAGLELKWVAGCDRTNEHERRGNDAKNASRYPDGLDNAL